MTLGQRGRREAPHLTPIDVDLIRAVVRYEKRQPLAIQLAHGVALVAAAVLIALYIVGYADMETWVPSMLIAITVLVLTRD